jgi:hypothetical protein
MFTDEGAQLVVSRLARARQVVRTIVRSGPRGPAFDLRKHLRPIPQIERQLVVIAARLEYLARVQRASRMIAKDEGLKNERERLTATAEQALDGIEALPSSLARLQFTRIAACDGRSDDVARDTVELLRSIEAFAGELGADAAK